MAFGRCKTLSPIGLLAMNATRIFDIIMEFLCKHHIEYATDYALLMLPNHDPKVLNLLKSFFFDKSKN